MKEKKKPLIFAHRGANSFAPENSLAAFEHALRLGCDGVEMDLRYSASGDVVVFHDRKMKRTTGKAGKIENIDLAEIKSRRLEGSKENCIPTLQEVLDLLQDKLLINLEIKKGSVRSNGFEEKIIKILKDFNLKENIVISSFNPFVLKKTYLLSPGTRLGFIYQKRSHKLFSSKIPLESMHIYYKILSHRYVMKLQNLGLKVYTWTVDEVENMRRMIDLGINGIITNRPEIFYQSLDDSLK